MVTPAVAHRRQGRRSFSDDFRAKAVQMALSGVQTVKAIAEDLDLNPSVLHNWIRQAKEQSYPPPSLVEALKPENVARFQENAPKRGPGRPKKAELALVKQQQDQHAIIGVTETQLSLPILEEVDLVPCQRLKRVAVRAGLSTEELVTRLMELAMIEGIRGK